MRRTLVNDTERIALVRRDAQDSSHPNDPTKHVGVNYAYAWEEGVQLEQMQIIEWDKTEQAWYAWDPQNNDWLLSGGKKLKWNPVNKRFE